MSEIDQTAILDRGEPDDYVRLSAHPRARRGIARSKAIGGVVGFLLGFWMGWRSGLPAFDTGTRALTGGIAGYLILWIAAIQIWRQLALAEFRHAEKQRHEQRLIQQAALEEIRRRRAEEREAARAGG